MESGGEKSVCLIKMQEIKITLETLYDILRNEKQREDLSKVNETFFLDVVNYLKEKKKLLDAKQDEDDLFAAGEREKLEYEMRSIKRILKEIYEKREKKIIDMALNRSRTKSDIIDTSILLREENDFYKQLVGLLDGYREGILLNLFKGEIPFFQKPEVRAGWEEKRLREIEEKEKERLEIKEGLEENSEEDLREENSEEDLREENLKRNEGARKEEESDLESKRESFLMKKIRIIHPVPSFVWKDKGKEGEIKEHGPYDVGEEIEMFAEVADLMIEKGRAVDVG